MLDIPLLSTDQQIHKDVLYCNNYSPCTVSSLIEGNFKGQTHINWRIITTTLFSLRGLTQCH